MPKLCYVPRKFGADTLAAIVQANKIIAEYSAAGFTLTLRQLYYQFVARGLIENTVRSYKRLGDVVNNGRLAGLIDWEAIEDRTRNLHSLATWTGPESVLRSAASSFRRNKWDNQSVHVEVWVEKEALAGVFADVCDDLEVPMFPCRGYPSQSEVWGAAQRLMRIRRGKVTHGFRKGSQRVLILHFGDHDPSGIDMTRDIEDRLRLLSGGERIEIRRLALNMDQVEEHEPPPNPAKETDSRWASYADQFGTESWELDALEPTLLAQLVRDGVAEVIDQDKWDEDEAADEEDRQRLTRIAGRWEEIVEFLGPEE